MANGVDEAGSRVVSRINSLDVDSSSADAYGTHSVAGFALSGIAVILTCVYGFFMLLHFVAIVFGRRWFYSRSGNRSTTSSLIKDGSSYHSRDSSTSVHSHQAEQVGVSIIKPLVGFDKNMRTNLESFFQLDYKNYEIIFCIGEEHDAPSLPVVNELMALYPSVSVRIFKGGETVGINPKINNMVPGYRNAKFDLIWICDGGILTTPDTLKELTSHIVSNPRVALVHQLPFITSTDESLPSYLDKVYFGTQHSRVYILASLLGENCANGMSWLVRKDALETEGGLAAFSDYLAEDFFMGKALWKKGWKFALSTLPAQQNPSVRSFSSYGSRIVRWCRLRATMMPWPGLLEPFTECLGLGVIAATCLNYMFGVDVVLFLILHAAVWFLCDLMLIKTIENGPIGSIWKIFCVWCIRELWTFPLFIAGVWSREVNWKGQRYKLQFGGKAIKID